MPTNRRSRRWPLRSQITAEAVQAFRVMEVQARQMHLPARRRAGVRSLPSLVGSQPNANSNVRLAALAQLSIHPKPGRAQPLPSGLLRRPEVEREREQWSAQFELFRILSEASAQSPS